MQIVTAAAAEKFDTIVAAEAYGDKLVLAHADGTVVLHANNGTPLFVWLNPGKRVTAVAEFDSSVLVAFSDGLAHQFSTESGMIIGNHKFGVVNHFAVFEHAVMCFASSSTTLLVLERPSLDLVQEVPAPTFIVAVFDIRGTVVVCSSGVYRLRDTQLDLQFSTDLMIAAVPLGHRIALLGPKQWRLVSPEQATSHDEFCIDAPADTALVAAVKATVGTVVQCTNNTYVLLRENNVQVVQGPTGATLLTAHGVVGDLVYDFELDQGELVFRARPMKAERAEEKYLLGQSDPFITAEGGGGLNGHINGEVNGVAVLPEPVLLITDKQCSSAHYYIELPLQPVNLIKEHSMGLFDARVTVQINTKPGECKPHEWIGVHTDDCVCLQPCNSQLPHIAALLVLGKMIGIDEAVAGIAPDNWPGIVVLEDLAVHACESQNELLPISAKLLEALWGSQRQLQLQVSAGPRSVRVLAVLAPFGFIDRTRLRKMLIVLSQSTQPADRKAALWVFNYEPEVARTELIPFAATTCLCEAALARFSQNLVLRSPDKLLADAETVLGDMNSPAKHISPSAADEAQALKMLHVAVSAEFPPDKLLAHLVRSVLPSIRRRAPYAKSVLTKLLTLNRVQYHKIRQKLLVATPHATTHSGVVLDVGGPEQLLLARVPGDTQLVFSADGKSVLAAVGQKRYAWSLVRTFSMFRGDTVEPEEID